MKKKKSAVIPKGALAERCAVAFIEMCKAQREFNKSSNKIESNGEKEWEYAWFKALELDKLLDSSPDVFNDEFLQMIYEFRKKQKINVDNRKFVMNGFKAIMRTIESMQYRTQEKLL